MQLAQRGGVDPGSDPDPDHDPGRRAASGEEREEPICRIARSGGLWLYLLVIRVVPQPYSVSISRIPYPISHILMTLHTYVPTYLLNTHIIRCPIRFFFYYFMSVSRFRLRFWSRSRLHTCRSRSSFLLLILIPHSPTTSPSPAHLVSRDSHVNAYLKAFLEPQASHPPYPLTTPLRYVPPRVLSVSRSSCPVFVFVFVSISPPPSRCPSRPPISHLSSSDPSLSLSFSLSPVCSPHIPEL